MFLPENRFHAGKLHSSGKEKAVKRSPPFVFLQRLAKIRKGVDVNKTITMPKMYLIDFHACCRISAHIKKTITEPAAVTTNKVVLLNLYQINPAVTLAIKLHMLWQDV